MHLVCYFTYYPCLCTILQYHPYFVIVFYTCVHSNEHGKQAVKPHSRLALVKPEVLHLFECLLLVLYSVESAACCTNNGCGFN